MPTIVISELRKSPGAMHFWAMRGLAMQAFADYEQGSCRIFEALTGMPDDIARLVFFKVSDRRAQIDIMGDLLSLRGCKDLAPYFNVISRVHTSLNGERNAIAHWNSVTVIDTSVGKAKIRLVPNARSKTGELKTKEEAMLLQFIDKCDYYAERCRMLGMALKVNRSSLADTTAAWRVPFQKAFATFK